MAEIQTSPFAYAAGSEKYRGTLIVPPGSNPSSAVVLLPDWRGQSALAQDHARFLAERGSVVVIADLYGNGFSPTDPGEVGAMVKRLLDDRAVGVAALGACVTAVRARLRKDAPVFCLGYSAGGVVALDYGRSGGELAGIILCSALLKTAAPGMSARIRPPVLVLQGTQDQVSPIAVIEAVIAEMDTAGNDFRFELYGGTHHAFDNPEAGTDPAARLVYSPTAAARARRAIADFIVDRMQG
jgi:dienelactone hydrolase